MLKKSKIRPQYCEQISAIFGYISVILWMNVHSIADEF